MKPDGNVLHLPCFIDGKFIWEGDDYLLSTTSSGIRVKETRARKWMCEAAIETASRVQSQISSIPLEKIFHVLSETMKYFYEDENDYNLFVKLTGSPYEYIHSDMEALKKWVSNFQDYYQHVFGPREITKSTAPIVAILPDNSDEETVFVLSQALASRNAVIVRPSTRNDCSYSSILFVKALCKAIDRINDPSLEILKSAVSILNIPPEEYLSMLGVSGWNYIVFGDDSTVRCMTIEFGKMGVSPRKVVAYGSGLSTSIIMNDANLDYVPVIAESIFVNRGNECFSSDIIYVQSNIYDSFVADLEDELQKARSKDPFLASSIGLVPEQNINYIEEQSAMRGKSRSLRLEQDENGKRLNPSVFFLHEFESAIEYPGPIASIRMFEDNAHLQRLLAKDLADNEKHKSLTSSVFTEEHFEEVVPLLSAFTIKHNKGTHEFDPMIPHQGVFLLRELVDVSVIQD